MLTDFVKQVRARSLAGAGQLVSPQVLHWTRVLSRFVSVQLLVQVLGAMSGILIIRTLEPTQYAYFTIANSMQATMNLLADLGISTGLLSIGGRVWQDRYRFGQLINTTFMLRRFLAAGVTILVTPFLLWLLLKNGATWSYSLIVALIVLVELNFRITNNIYHVVLRLYSQVGRIQNLDFSFAISRLVLIGVAYLIYLNAAIAILASTLSTGFQRWLIGRWMQGEIAAEATPHAGDKAEILNLVKRQAPYFIFYCIQGQFTIWLISIFGSTKGIAEIGALSRLGLFLAIVGSVVNYIVAPSFARSQSKKQLQRIYFQTLGVFGLLAVLLVAFSIFFPKALLWILGSNYSHLENEVALAVVGAMVTALVAMMWSLNTAKAWVGKSWLIIPTTVVTQIMGLLILDVSQVKDVIVFGILSILPTVFVNIYMTYRGLLDYESN